MLHASTDEKKEQEIIVKEFKGPVRCSLVILEDISGHTNIASMAFCDKTLCQLFHANTAL